MSSSSADIKLEAKQNKEGKTGEDNCKNTSRGHSLEEEEGEAHLCKISGRGSTQNMGGAFLLFFLASLQ